MGDTIGTVATSKNLRSRLIGENAPEVYRPVHPWWRNQFREANPPKRRDGRGVGDLYPQLVIHRRDPVQETSTFGGTDQSLQPSMLAERDPDGKISLLCSVCSSEGETSGNVWYDSRRATEFAQSHKDHGRATKALNRLDK